MSGTDQGWAVDDGTCDACYCGMHHRCTTPKVWPDPDDPEAPDTRFCCCNEGYEL